MRKRVGDIFCRNVIGVPEDAKVSEALRIMSEQSISSILVLEGGRAKGIFTERDVVRNMAEQGAGFHALPIREVMSPNVFAISADTHLFEAFRMLEEHNIRHLVVQDADRCAIGMVTQSDMIMHLGYEYFLRVKYVSQIMSREVFTIGRECSAEEAVREMALRKVSVLVVVQDQRPVGVFTERDVTRLATAAVDLGEVRVAEVMSSPVITLHEDEATFHMAEVVREHGIRRVVVVDYDDRIVGVATQTDLVRGMESKYIESLKSIIKVQGQELDRTVRQLTEKIMYLDSILRTSIAMGIVATDASLVVSYFNPAAEEILNCVSGQVLGHGLLEIHERLGIDPERLELVMAKVQAGQDHLFSFQMAAPDGTRHVQARVSGIRGLQGSMGLVLMLRDVTSQHKAEEVIRHLAYYDTLTELPNRALFNERIERELIRARRSGKFLALMAMDVDRFKEVNDTLGHAAGDRLLRTVADRLRGLLRKSDTLARVGGDEFLFILPEVHDLEDALRIGGKVLEALRPDFDLGERLVPISFSLGVALFPRHGRDVEELMRRADEAMYSAKDKGRESGSSTLRACPE